jgi:hypothetical protein
MNSKNDSSQNTPKTMLRRTDFDKQLTQAVMERVLKQTLQLISLVERKTPWRDQLGADDRLHTAILKTLEGSRKWDPDRVDLGGHLFGVVSSTISHELRHGKRFEHVSLDDDDQDLEALRQETEDALAERADASTHVASEDVPTEDAWTLAMRVLRHVARRELNVLALLDAYDQGAMDKRAVMCVTKLKSRAYAAAYARLVELASTVDDDTRDLIMQALA